MLAQFKSFIRSNHLFSSEDKLLLAISGGVDSVVLADLLKEAGCHFSLAHCNFGLRGTESDGDEQFVREYAHQLGVPLFCKRFEGVKSQGESTQMVARNLRYQWFELLCKENGFTNLLVAHHADDQLETILMNFVRGTGVSGLRGMKLKQGHIVRPLLNFSREEITNYAKERGLQWREDSSNASTKYRRNEMRHKVIPLLKEINPSLLSSMGRMTERLSGVEKLFENSFQQFVNQGITFEGELIFVDTQVLENQVDSLLVLSEFLQGKGFSFEQAKAVLQGGEMESGRQFFSKFFELTTDRKRIILRPLQSSDEDKTQLIFSDEASYSVGSIQLNTSIHSKEKLRLQPLAEMAFLDFESLVFPLKLRNWKQGDRFRPLGMKGMKKVSDFLIDAKVPLVLKNEVKVLEDADGNIVWLVGMRIDDRFKMKDDSKRIFHISLKNLKK